MKKLRLIAGIAFVVMLCCLLAVSASAKWWDDNPFTDVKSTSWYYDAVRICNENGLFEGMTETTFATSTGMTRSMFVTVLAAADDDYDASKYTESSFSDIRSGSWYLAPAEWANSIGIANGVGDGIFGPKNNITRQELAVMLYKYAQYKGMDVTLNGSVDMKAYPDNSAASSWATTALEWAVQNELISGVANGNETLLSPKGTATRAMVAQIMVKYLALSPVREINGNDISLYNIVYNENEKGSECPNSDTAEYLADMIERSIGVKLPVVTDETEVGQYEILVGKTNREEKGIVTVDRTPFAENEDFICTVQGDYLIITGTDSENNHGETRTELNLSGTRNAVAFFIEKEFGVEYYSGGEGIIAKPDPIISLEDGYVYEDGPEFKQRIIYLKSPDGGTGNVNSGGYYSDWSVGYPHQLGNLMFGYWKTKEDDVGASENPCFTDQDNIDSLIKNIRILLEEKPYVNLVGLIQNDSDKYCTCDNCNEVYREYKSRCGALIRMCNIVCETFAEEYPEVKFVTWAYGWSHIPPTDTVDIHKNVVVYYNTIALCPSHAYTDTTCKYNKNSAKNIKKWGEAVDELYVWDHSGDFVDSFTPVPNIDIIRENAKYFDDNGAEGAFLNGEGGLMSDFNFLRCYLFGRLYRDPQMSEEEYDYHINHFLEAYYGDGWKSLRAYIDTINELGGGKCQGWHSPTNSFYDYDEVLAVMDKMDSYWEDAYAGVRSEAQRRNVEIEECSWIYLRQCALYESMYKNGTAESRAEYVRINTELYNRAVEYGITIGTYQLGDPVFVESASPEDWTS